MVLPYFALWLVHKTCTILPKTNTFKAKTILTLVHMFDQSVYLYLNSHELILILFSLYVIGRMSWFQFSKTQLKCALLLRVG